MIFYPNCKINLGLQIIQKRPDGYHDLETVFYPLSMPCDILEIVRSTDSKSTIKVTGPFFVENDENNICCKACEILQKDYSFPFLKINLHKQIPFGAGLGGGSSDAAMTLKAIRDEFKLPLDDQQLKYYAEQLGSDVPFFLYNRPMLAKGRGEILTPIELDLKGYYLTLIKPKTMVSTAKAYAGITPQKPAQSLVDILCLPIETWKENLHNDFEKSIFLQYPEIKYIKEKLYAQGALYASMSGSGSAIYALSRKPLEMNANLPETDLMVQVRL